jgi:DtxR family Mn-dependent transcriptional regulator
MSEPLIFLLIILGMGIFIALIFWPEKGVVAFGVYQAQRKKRVKIEDTLKFIQHSELHGEAVNLNTIAGALNISPAKMSGLLEQMANQHLIEYGENKIHLTPKGVDYALHITRAHHLWEEFYAQETGLPLEEIHRRADMVEHTATDEELEALSSQLGNPMYDPHGDPIPSAKGKIKGRVGKSLLALETKQTLRITHLEDEPKEVFTQLIAEGLYPGMYIYLIEKGRNKIRFWSKFGEHILSPTIADNISATPVRDFVMPQKRTVRTMSELQLGEKAEIEGLSPSFRSIERRRLMDLGFLPGTVVEAKLKGSHDDPIAYGIRGSLIALRKEQANLIEVKANHSEKGE